MRHTVLRDLHLGCNASLRVGVCSSLDVRVIRFVEAIFMSLEAIAPSHRQLLLRSIIIFVDSCSTGQDTCCEHPTRVVDVQVQTSHREYDEECTEDQNVKSIEGHEKARTRRAP